MPTRSTLTFENVATPAVGVADVLPLSVPPPGLVPIATVPAVADPVTPSLFESSPVPITGGLAAGPASAGPGRCPK